MYMMTQQKNDICLYSADDELKYFKTGRINFISSVAHILNFVIVWMVYGVIFNNG